MASDSVARALAVAALSSGGGEPDTYLKSASTSGNTLTLTNKDDTTVTFTPTSAVTSVNNKTGAVTLYGTDINMSTDTSLPTVTEQISSNKDNIGDLATQLGGKQDTLTAGSGIDITSNEISIDLSNYSTSNDIIVESTGENGLMFTSTAAAGFTAPTAALTSTNNDDKLAALYTMLNDDDPAVYISSGSPDMSEGSLINVSEDSIAIRTDSLTLNDSALVPVSGTNDGTNWSTITIGNTTKAIPSGGGSSYTAGDGIDITNHEISIDTDYAKESLEVKAANELLSSDNQEITGSFISRTSGGSADIDNGNASIKKITGNTTNPTAVSASVSLVDAVNATINTETYLAYAAAQGDTTGTKVFTADDANYGIALNGDASATASYTAPNLGLYVNATPTALNSTQFNQYDHSNTRVYTISGNRYQIFGTYTSVGSETIETDVTVGSYTIPTSFVATVTGYQTVVGGNSTDTMIALVWSGYNYAHTYEAYSESSVDIPDIAAWGLCKFGTVADTIEWDSNICTYTKRIERVVAGSAPAGTTKYTDSTYDYYVLTTPVTTTSTSSPVYECNDFGQEIFAGTTVAVGTDILYGQNLKDKLRRDVLTISEQELTIAQQNQVYDNLNLGCGRTPITFTRDLTSDSSNTIYFTKSTELAAVTGEQTTIPTIKVTLTSNGVSSTANYVHMRGGYYFNPVDSTSKCELDGKTLNQVFNSTGNAWLTFSGSLTSGISFTLSVETVDAFTYTTIDSNLLPVADVAINSNGAIYSSNRSTGYTTLGSGAICVGQQSAATQNQGVALGYTAQTTASGAIAIGNSATASGFYSLVAGPTASSNSSGSYGVALGFNAQSNASGAIAIGQQASTWTNKTDCIAIGHGTQATANKQVVLGTYNTTDATKAFIIGNGTSSATSNLLTVSTGGVLQCTNIPAQPATDGNYVLKCSITNGVATYSWVQDVSYSLSGTDLTITNNA